MAIEVRRSSCATDLRFCKALERGVLDVRRATVTPQNRKSVVQNRVCSCQLMVYTADIENTRTEVHTGGLDVKVEAAYLVGVDSAEWMEEVETSMAGNVITDEVLMHLVLLPLTYKGDEDKQIAIRRCVNLAKEIQDEEKKNFAVAGLLAFTDKVISEETRSEIMEVLMMTQVGKMIFDEGVEKGIEKGIVTTARNMLKAGEAREKIRAYTGLSDEAIDALEEE